ncbi:aromatic acid exporter family protein [Anaerocolumna jejuensis]|uniref:aromatic acid exporter family protein n=1 Tax=Anaerocolumna jejuensis TaxID=259063 RepID=UPI003F7B6BA6
MNLLFTKNSIKKINYIQLIKIAIGSCIAILSADKLGIHYSASAGIITLLSIQSTKKETILITGKRFLSFLLSVATAFLIFSLLKFNAFSFGIFLLVFVGACYLMKLEDGIAMNAVLTTHFLIEKSVSFYWISNELSLLIIGAGIGVLLNLYIPRNTLAIKQNQLMIEEDMKLILSNISTALLAPGKEPVKVQLFQPLEAHLNEALSRAYENMNNTLLSDTRYYIQYMQMRKSQGTILKRICTHIASITTVPRQAHKISDFIAHITRTFHEYNNALTLLERLQEIKLEFKADPLPGSREEFEDRAILFQILNELEAFLLLKKEFVMALTDTQLQNYWKQQNERS